jgi:phosphatidylglycerophosphate synthase
MLDALLNRPGSPSDRALAWLTDRLVAAGVPANALSHAALATGVAAGACFGSGRGAFGLAVLAVSGLLDAVDGRVARRGAGPTPWGGVLDLTYDRIVEASVLLGIALPRPDLHVPGLVLAATWYVNLCVFLAVGAASAHVAAEKLIAYPPGLVERTEALVFAAIAVALPAAAPAACWVYAALEIVTAAQRFRHGRHALRRHASGGAGSRPPRRD